MDQNRHTLIVKQEIMQKFSWIVRIRFIAALLILMVFAVIRIGGWLKFPFALFAIAPLFEMFINQPYDWIVKRTRNTQLVFIVNQILDILAITWGVHFVGGMNMFVVILVYPLVFIFTGIVLNPKRTYFMANFAFISYAVMVLLEYHNIIPVIPTVEVNMAGSVRLVFTLLVFPFYNLIAFYVSYLTGMISKRENELMTINQELNFEISERKEIEGVLQENEQKYRTIFELSPEAIVLLDTKGKILDVNRRLYDWLGYEPKEVIGKNLIALPYLPMNSKAKVTKKFLQRMFGKKLLPYELEFITKTGEKRVGTVNANPIKDENGKIIGDLAMISDVTESKRAEEALKKSEKKYKTLTENVSVGIYRTTKGPKGKFIEANPAVIRMFGYNHRKDFLEIAVSDLYEDPAERNNYNRKMIRDGFVKNEEVKFKKKDGTTFTCSDSAVAVKDKKGKVKYYDGIIEDITERKEAEEDLQYRLEFEKLIATISTNFINLNIKEIDNWIRQALQALGEFAGVDRSYIFLFSDDGKKMDNTYEWCEEGIDPQIQHLKGISVDVFPWWMEQLNRLEIIYVPRVADLPPEASAEKEILQAQAVQSLIVLPIVSSGALIGFFGFDSVREEKIWPEENASLLRIVREFFSNIMERKRREKELIETREAALQASKAKSEFLASMSHEIRTPMNAIIGMAELLWETSLTSEQKQYVRVFRSAGENLLSIINDILDISKVETGHIELENIEFFLGELLEKTGETLAIRAHAKDLELSCSINPDVPSALLGDPIRLQQVIVNLIGNAIKFTEEGEVVLRVENDKENKKPGSLLFSVSDTGIGIPEEKLETIFESFTQADSSTTRKYGGTGLGLAISNRLVELMKGHIWVESELGTGSTFYFTAEFGIQTKAKKRKPLPPVDMKGLKILVVDDNETNRLILRETLTNWDTQVAEAESGDLALDELKRAKSSGDHYELVLLDSRMPGKDGFQVAENIKKDPGLADVTIMMLTSTRRRGDIKKCQELGIASYLVKPIKKSDLEDAIKTAIAKTEIVSEEPEAVEIAKAQYGLNILLVEDSEDNRFLIQAYLKKSPHKLTIAENGEIAVKELKSDKYDLVLMDMQMPVMDGYTATKKIREWENKEGLEPNKIIALTAYALKEEVQKCLDAGCDEHLSKPIKKATLLETINKYTRSDKT